jgi:hypothetical protein
MTRSIIRVRNHPSEIEIHESRPLSYVLLCKEGKVILGVENCHFWTVIGIDKKETTSCPVLSREPALYEEKNLRTQSTEILADPQTADFHCRVFPPSLAVGDLSAQIVPLFKVIITQRVICYGEECGYIPLLILKKIRHRQQFLLMRSSIVVDEIVQIVIPAIERPDDAVVGHPYKTELLKHERDSPFWSDIGLAEYGLDQLPSPLTLLMADGPAGIEVQFLIEPSAVLAFEDRGM